MDFSDTPAEAAYRAEVRAWLDANAPVRSDAQRLRRTQTEDIVDEGKAWQAKKALAGYAAITKPKEWGGGGGSVVEDVIFGEEEDARGLYYGIYAVGVGMCVPTILAYGDAATKAKLVPPSIRGETLWSQMFSEPAAGSDLAAVRCRATREGDDWIITGQKIWNSNAHVADYGILLTRSDFDGPKHKGLTMFWVDLAHRQGLEIRRINQISGLSDFNECHFADYRIPDSQRIGPVGEGWKVALVTLMNERLAIGSRRAPDWPELLRLARDLDGPRGPLIDDTGFRERLSDWYIRAEGLRLTRARALTALSRGEQPGPEMSIGKLVQASQAQDLAIEATDLLQEFGILDDPAVAPLAAAFQQSFLLSPAARIAGGTDEILKNIIAERVLRLPADLRVDKNLPFRDIPTSGRG